MPCNSDHMAPTQQEIKASNGVASQLKHLADELTHSCDVLREYILGNADHTQVMKHVNRQAGRAFEVLEKKSQGLYVRVDNGLLEHVESLVDEYTWLNAFATREAKVKPSDFDRISKDQYEHRKEDIARLIKTFANSGDIPRLRLVLDATANAPLAPQLGFDPDDF